MIQLILLFPIYLIVNLSQIIIIAIHLFRDEIDQKGIQQRFGINLPKGKFDIWIHCSSLGEAKVLTVFIQSLVKIKPDLKFLISVQRNTAKNYIDQHLDCTYKTIYFPLDAKWLWRIFFKRIKVKNLICIESEIWPRLFSCKDKFGLKIFVINARMSTDSYYFFKKLNYLFHPIFNTIDAVYTQNKTYSRRFNSLGVKLENIKDAGNIKYDLVDISHPANQTELKQTELNETEKYSPNLCFVSTREGEEEIIAKILPDLFNQFKSLRVLIAPRHQSRFDEVYQLFEKLDLENHPVKKYSEEKLNHSLVVVDQFDQMPNIYPMSDLVVVCGTLEDFGGHSIIEPASYKKAVLVGPFTDHIDDDVALFKNHQAIVQVQAKKTLIKQLKKAMIALLNQPEKQQSLANNAFNLVQSQKGVSENIANHLMQLVQLKKDKKNNKNKKRFKS